ncbi:hypothetical protein AGR4B_Cc70272 [Agrobacterium tumefaciens str. CFBP 5621]|nr:hypothetical protein AGR4B_Cc70272 [Agrobacterium tumefaciens str. CFBP 5621]
MIISVNMALSVNPPLIGLDYGEAA